MAGFGICPKMRMEGEAIDESRTERCAGDCAHLCFAAVCVNEQRELSVDNLELLLQRK